MYVVILEEEKMTNMTDCDFQLGLPSAEIIKGTIKFYKSRDETLKLGNNVDLNKFGNLFFIN